LMAGEFCMVFMRSEPNLGSSDGTFPIVSGYRLFFQFNREIKMRHLIVAVCCAALMGSMSVASAQTTGPAGQQVVKAGDPMNANAKTKKKHKAKKAMAKPDDGMKKDTK
jgi:allophanate hydrolase subunit 2